jgi:methylglutaconyl-CoA hydratase
LRIAGDRAVLGLPETSLAIIPGAGGTQRLPRLIGAPRAKELIFTAGRVDASRAEAMGLVNHAVPAGQAMAKALELAAAIAANGPIAVRLAKGAIAAGMQTDLATALEIERGGYAQVVTTKDRTEGLVAFREKRKPAFKGE